MVKMDGNEQFRILDLASHMGAGYVLRQDWNIDGRETTPVSRRAFVATTKG